jgi:hypothetical protein
LKDEDNRLFIGVVNYWKIATLLIEKVLSAGGFCFAKDP